MLLFSKGKNVPDKLMSYRVHSSQVSQVRKEHQQKMHVLIGVNSIANLLNGYSVTPEQWESVLALINPRKGWKHPEDAWKNRAAITMSRVYVEFVKRYGWNRHLHPARQLAKSVRRLVDHPQPGVYRTILIIGSHYVKVWMMYGAYRG